jgi:tetratricopeptide (TPR) repeat protein
MSIDPIPEETASLAEDAPPTPKEFVAVPEESGTGEPQPLGNSPAKRRAIAIVVAAAILVLPIGYLVQHHRLPHDVSAQHLAQPAPGPSIAQLEEIEHGNPSVNNRITLSVAYINGNQAVRAISLLDSVIAEDGKNAIAWNDLCVAHTMQMEFNIAIEDCNNAIRIAPDFQLAKNNLNWAQDEKQKAITAITAQEQIAPASRNADSYLAEGLDDLHIGNYDQAIHSWRRALELNPKDALAANNIGSVYMTKKQPAIAISWFQNAIAMDPALQIAKNNLAWARDELAKAKQ